MNLQNPQHRLLRVGRSIVNYRKYSSGAENDNESKKTGLSKTSADESGMESISTKLNKLLSSMPAEDIGYRNSKSNGNVTSKGTTLDYVAHPSPDAQSSKSSSQLLCKLLNLQKQGAPNSTNDMEAANMCASDIIIGMKVNRTKQSKENTGGRAPKKHLVAKDIQHREPRSASDGLADYDKQLFSFKSLNIFAKDSMSPKRSDLSTWSYLDNHRYALIQAKPHRNYFDKISSWTECGKVRRFPHKNEYNLDNSDFAEHILFHEELAQQNVLNKSPIRAYMEAVCIGLSKNPYISVKEKREHLLWYADYFQSKLK